MFQGLVRGVGGLVVEPSAGGHECARCARDDYAAQMQGVLPVPESITSRGPLATAWGDG